jgi:hypothetical protein
MLTRRCVLANSQSNSAGRKLVWPVISFQKARRFFNRSSGRLPAMIAALIAPIDIPAIQSGRYSEDANAS